MTSKISYYVESFDFESLIVQTDEKKDKPVVVDNSKSLDQTVVVDNSKSPDQTVVVDNSKSLNQTVVKEDPCYDEPEYLKALNELYNKVNFLFTKEEMQELEKNGFRIRNPGKMIVIDITNSEQIDLYPMNYTCEIPMKLVKAKGLCSAWYFLKKDNENWIALPVDYKSIEKPKDIQNLKHLRQVITGLYLKAVKCA